ncbi:ABC transporter permease [Geodermatophilus sabuli]|uniref:Monosaccharide ABC transporter membrane protein, CUT2 family n=1 Tax=Geodermatophilus sabuli TaxID=1564158 RepID=A0A285ECJ6_9ACTN|nr:ABC transporter permease [Geodermatophilus sabuli]MBB3083562.1 ribose transport system permease protein [Geodermatophilus sabuli]SNX96717.1 monosaccharide ABC transporter membrane protein, CUT2 family [Geodermatophilus sabuli]
MSAAVAAGTRPRRISLADLTRTGAAVWIVLLAAVLALTVADAGGFWAPANIANVLTATVVLGLAALGQHLVVLSGGIDLSIGSAATLSALLTALLINGYPIRTAPVVIGMLLLGGLIGVLHGLLVARVGLPPFIVTLATLYLIQGAAFTISTTPTGRVTSALSAVALERIGPVPYSFAVLVLAVAVVAFVLARTAFGRQLYAVGGDPAAARANGVPVARVLVTAYVLAGVLAALAGVLLAARATVGSPTAGLGLELSTITVVVLGGTSLLGGRGSLVGTLGGVLLLSLVSSSVTLLQLPATLTDLIRGVVILAAAAIFVTRARR